MQGLIIETSTSYPLLGLLKGEEVLTEISLPESNHLSSTLFVALKPLISGLSYIGVGIGPGSYIGMRTGATVAKTLSFALGLPLLSFPSSLIFIPQEMEGDFILVGDAKLGECYSIKGMVNGQTISFAPPILTKTPELEGGEYLIDIRLSLPVSPHLQWVAKKMNSDFNEKRAIPREEISLSYLR